MQNQVQTVLNPLRDPIEDHIEGGMALGIIYCVLNPLRDPIEDHRRSEGSQPNRSGAQSTKGSNRRSLLEGGEDVIHHVVLNPLRDPIEDHFSLFVHRAR